MVTAGVLELLAEAVVSDGPFEVDGALNIEVVDVKWLPGPVSSLGSGAVKGSNRYLLACGSYQ